MIPSDELARRFLPVVIGARAGDAMGAPTEGISYEDISRRFGWVDDFAGDGTDDSLMATLLAEALLDSDGHAGADEWAAVTNPTTSPFRIVVEVRDLVHLLLRAALSDSKRGPWIPSQPAHFRFFLGRLQIVHSGNRLRIGSDDAIQQGLYHMNRDDGARRYDEVARHPLDHFPQVPTLAIWPDLRDLEVN